jgi:uncharacterized protein YraI
MRNPTYILLLICCCLLVLFTAVNASDGTEIFCYTGSSPNYEYIGTVEVFNLSVATSTCNNVYYNCQGTCIGCYLNAESIEMCIDNNGNQFVKE